MNPVAVNQTGGTLATIVPAVVAWMVGKGWIPGGAAAEVTAAILAAAAAGYSIWQNSKSRAIATVANLPDVQKVITTPQLANTGALAANAKVVSK